MKESDQVDAFSNALIRVINRYREEFDLTLESVIGTLEILKLELFKIETEE